MSDLNADLDALKTEIERVQAGGSNETLAKLLHKVEEKLDTQRDDDDPGLLERLEDASTHYEVTHPELTNIVSRIVDILSASGI